MASTCIVRRLTMVLASVAALCAFAAAAPAFQWEEPVEIATGRGEKGPWRQNDSRYDYVDDATVAFARDGGLYVAWVDQKQKDVLFLALDANGARKGTPVNVSGNPTSFSWLPRIVALPGKTYVLWQEIIFSGGAHGGDILFSRSDDGGKTFSKPLNLSSSRGGDGKGRINRDIWSNGSLDLAATPDGTVLATWTEYDGALWLARSTDGGATFSRPQRIAGDGTRPARGPALAAGPGKTVYLAWTVGEAAAANIRVAQSDDGGITFGKPQLVGAGPGYADAPRLAVDGRGTLHLMYAQSAAGPFGRYEVRYARSAGGADGFGAPRTISPPGGDGAAFPALALDARGIVYVAWEIFPDAGSRPRGLALTFSSGERGEFAPPVEVPGSRDAGGGTNGSHQGLLGKKLDVAADGRIAVVNSSLVPNDRSRVWLMRGRLVF